MYSFHVNHSLYPLLTLEQVPWVGFRQTFDGLIGTVEREDLHVANFVITAEKTAGRAQSKIVAFRQIYIVHSELLFYPVGFIASCGSGVTNEHAHQRTGKNLCRVNTALFTSLRT